MDIRGKPQVTAKISSKHLELGELTPRPPGQDDQGPAPQPATHNSKAGLVFSERLIDFGWLRRANGDVDITIDTLQMPVERFHDFELTAHLVNGRLDISRIAMVGSREGNGSGSLVLEPVGDGYRMELDLDLNAIRFDLPGEDATDVATRPPLDIDVRLKAQGTSPHDFASSSDGSIQIIAGKGVMDSRVLDLISADILLTLLKAFNPFAKEDVATELQCAIALLTFEDGVAKLDPMVMQSNKMTMLGDGKIDLGTEKLESRVGHQTAQGHRHLGQHDHQPLYQARRHSRPTGDRAQTDGGDSINRCGRRHHGHFLGRQRHARPRDGREKGLHEGPRGDRILGPRLVQMISGR